MTEQTSWITAEQVSGQLDLVLDAPEVVPVEVSPPRVPKQTTVEAENQAIKEKPCK